MRKLNLDFVPRLPLACVHAFVLVVITGATGGCESSVATEPSPESDAPTAVADASNTDTSNTERNADGIPGVSVRYIIDGPSVFSMPFPTDLRRRGDGSLDLAGFPNPEQNNLVDAYVQSAATELDGFSVVPTVYFTFDDAIDVEGLTPTLLTGEAGANVILVNVDQSSFQYSVRIPVNTRFWSRDDGVYLPANTLTVQPVFGLPLKENTTYACLVLRNIGDASGQPLGQPGVVQSGLLGQGPLGDLFAPLNAWLKGFGSDIPQDQIAAATVFTTGAPTRELERIAAYIRDEVPVSPLSDIVALDEPSAYFSAYEGLYQSPNFQSGEKPYEVDGGAILFDAAGATVVQETETLRFAVTVPKGKEMPAAGWPLVFYGHGTGGDYLSFLRAGGNTPARMLAQRGLAVLSIDQPHHGDRGEGSDAVFLSFNFSNPDSARSNFRQSVADVLVQLKMAKQGLSMDTPDGLVSFDPDSVYFFGHSHGAVVGAMLIPFAPEFGGVVLSAAGGGLSHTLMLRKDLGGEPLDFAQLVQALLGTVDGELGVDHPVMSVLQMLVDITDPIAYAGLYNPPGGTEAPPNVLFTEGLLDAATPPTTTEYLAAAARVPILEPVQQASLTHDILGLKPISKPVTSNYTSKGGDATSVLAQFSGEDHFAVFYSTAASELVAQFLESAVENGLPVIE